MKDTPSKVVLNKNLEGPYWKMRFTANWKSFDPGQFVMIEVPGGAFLRKPFGIAWLEKGTVEICYKVVGRTTELMTKIKDGDIINVIGPIGRGFRLDDLKQSNAHFLVAGGYGIAPIFGLAKYLATRSKNVTVFYGARKEGDLLYLKEIKKSGAKMLLTTEDGSCGSKGLVTDELVRALSASKEQAEIYACGPNPMLAAVKTISDESEKVKSCQLSLEEYMACGVGVCSGCVVKDSSGNFVRVCTEGPVFHSDEIKL